MRLHLFFSWCPSNPNLGFTFSIRETLSEIRESPAALQLASSTVLNVYMVAHAAAIALLVTAALGVAGYVVRPAF